MKTFFLNFQPGFTRAQRKACIKAADAWAKSGKLRLIPEDGQTRGPQAIHFEITATPERAISYRAQGPDGTHYVQFSNRTTFSTATSMLGRIFNLGGYYNMHDCAMHELGHVFCGRGHVTGEADSVMNSEYLFANDKPSPRDFARILP